ncbi:hypothetical protein [Flammeovirga agarivorans]|uniref:Uncharacterized protein n=1 Tax=Flammeovirga agarivorans TaxID=2726742 RepID=A0A7X8XYV5_9BACT|nr:hypothetical protein [Flammeovirga agarivorans]NLR94561.1 hypothetical protein [Flammeovirga agarivorans]
MDLKHQKNNILNSFIDETIEKGYWENFNDIHIDDIDEEYSNKTSWVEGGLKCLNDTKGYLEKEYKDFTSFLIIPLESYVTKVGVNFKDEETLIRELSYTPPSLYICEKGWDNLKQTLDYGILLQNDIIKFKDFIFYHVEYKIDGDSEFRRSIIVCY